MTAPRVAIVGAGWAGMAAAVELADRGADVTVFEAARTLGGRARRVTLDGLPLDIGLHLLLGAYRDALATITRVADGDSGVPSSDGGPACGWRRTGSAP